MHGKGLFLSFGTSDLLRDPRIQGISDNLSIARQNFHIHLNKIDHEKLADFVSYLVIITFALKSYLRTSCSSRMKLSVKVTRFLFRRTQIIERITVLANEMMVNCCP